MLNTIFSVGQKQFKNLRKIAKKTVDKGRIEWYSNKALHGKQDKLKSLKKVLKKALTKRFGYDILIKLSAEPEAKNCTLKIR